MRFGISAAILAQALPAFALNNNKNNGIVVDETNPSTPKSHPLMTTPMDGDETQQSSLDPPSMVANFGSSGLLVNRSNPADHESMVKNLKKRFDARFGEKSLGSECDPDVGILTCGFGKICQADDTSSLGGVCAPKPVGDRRLYGLYDYCAAIQEYDCDCSKLSATSYTGTFSCTAHDHCFSDCQNVCSDLTVTYTLTSSRITIGLCYDFDTPYDQDFCFSTSVFYTSNSYGISCELKLGNKKCTSCELESDCGTWNCLNNGMGSGDFCNDAPLPPIVLTQCLGIDTSTEEWTSGTDPSMSFSTACTMGLSAAMVAAYGL